MFFINPKASANTGISQGNFPRTQPLRNLSYLLYSWSQKKTVTKIKDLKKTETEQNKQNTNISNLKQDKKTIGNGNEEIR